LAVSKFTESQLYGVKAFDALVLAGAAAALAITAAMAAISRRGVRRGSIRCTRCAMNEGSLGIWLGISIRSGPVRRDKSVRLR
jgi:hypothetical protein